MFCWTCTLWLAFEYLFVVSCQNAFLSDNPINFVINCAGETKSSQTDPVYKEGIYKLSMNCAQQAAKLQVDRYVEISSGNFSTSDKVCELWYFCIKQSITKISNL